MGQSDGNRVTQSATETHSGPLVRWYCGQSTAGNSCYLITVGSPINPPKSAETSHWSHRIKWNPDKSKCITHQWSLRTANIQRFLLSSCRNKLLHVREAPRVQELVPLWCHKGLGNLSQVSTNTIQPSIGWERLVFILLQEHFVFQSWQQRTTDYSDTVDLWVTMVPSAEEGRERIKDSIPGLLWGNAFLKSRGSKNRTKLSS